MKKKLCLAIILLAAILSGCTKQVTPSNEPEPETEEIKTVCVYS